ncbi:MAG: hypothetical protein A2951_02855 [Candidatus Buchananbacteria bacterium RIFCSPLOWO2_01_FULL_56_15]|uniref:Uncharacterized protein n=1 Tax=Candidatus Buchananbacteria bacterium RIFCSPLOWO2_01_FULL_56_15 TaxID=1797547 RepID=A0A1G1YR81_9BACT|nr:MAG: hypothetical protein A2951_02855 [Candidatus Buchananbacteria bacterium RIFCSPLOWO2_01_FULL_56_15]
MKVLLRGIDENNRLCRKIPTPQVATALAPATPAWRAVAAHFSARSKRLRATLMMAGRREPRLSFLAVGQKRA